MLATSLKSRLKSLPKFLLKYLLKYLPKFLLMSRPSRPSRRLSWLKQ
jgi:hypothetical protein